MSKMGSINGRLDEIEAKIGWNFTEICRRIEILKTRLEKLIGILGD